MTELSFRRWLEQFADDDTSLGQLARELGPAKSSGRGMWTLKRYRTYLETTGADDELLDALEDAWQRHQAERSELAPAEKAPERRVRPGMITVVLGTGAAPKTEIVSRDEFTRRLAGSPAANRYGSEQRFAVLRPAEIGTWKATAGNAQKGNP
jgi:hypothetical protein